MKAFLKYALGALGLIVLVVALFVLWVSWRSGALATYESRFAGTCTPVTGPASSEDIVIDRETGLVYLSAVFRVEDERQGPSERGTIAIYDLKTGGRTFTAEPLGQLEDFRPHGLSLYRGSDGGKRLFVINHLYDGGEAIEIFDLDEAGAPVHAETITGEFLTAPNNLAAVGPRQFYVANDSRAHSQFVQNMDRSFGLNRFPLAYYDGQTMRAVVRNGPSGGGIAVSPDGRYVYLAATSKKEILIYDRDMQTGDLGFLAGVDVGIGVDNLDVASDGAVWAAGHPNFFALAGHFMSGFETPSPSQVFRVPMTGGEAGAPEDVYLDAGDTYSASSVAAVYNGKMLIGSITETKIMSCDLPAA